MHVKKISHYLVMPLTDEMDIKNRDVFLQKMYLEVAGNTVDLGKKVQFRTIMILIKAIFDNYKVTKCW